MHFLSALKYSYSADTDYDESTNNKIKDQFMLCVPQKLNSNILYCLISEMK